MKGIVNQLKRTSKDANACKHDREAKAEDDGGEAEVERQTG